MQIMNIVVPVSLLLMTTCFGLESYTATKLEPQFEDDPYDGPEQKRDERQSTQVKNNNNLDANGNSRKSNIRIPPPPQQALTAPKQVIKPEVQRKRIDTTPQRIPTQIPVVLKTVKVVPGLAHAVRMKKLENKINQTTSTVIKEKVSGQNSVLIETGSGPNTIDDENSNIERNGTLGVDGITPENKDNNNYPKEDKNVQVTANSKLENTVPQSKEITINKMKEIPIAKRRTVKPKKFDIRKKDHENNDEPDVVQISNGTHILCIKKIQNPDNIKTEPLVSRNGEELSVPTEERIVNHPPSASEPPKSKPVADEPEKLTLSVTEKFNTDKDKNVGLAGLLFKDNKSTDDKDNNDCTIITNYNYEENEKPSPVSPPLTLLPTNLPTLNERNQESWNYLQNPCYNSYCQTLYDQYLNNHGLGQNTPHLYGQQMIDPRNYGAVQVSPYNYGQHRQTGSEIMLPYYPNGKSPTSTDSSQYPYTPIAYEPQAETANVPCTIGSEIRSENTLGRILRTWKDAELKVKKTDEPLEIDDIDIRRTSDDIEDGEKVDVIGKAVNPYATSSSLPITINGGLVYPYVNPGFRYMR